MPEPIEWTPVPKPPMLGKNVSLKKRLAICYECPELDLSGCKKCGCNVETMAAKKQNSCPLGKW